MLFVVDIAVVVDAVVVAVRQVAVDAAADIVDAVVVVSVDFVVDHVAFVDHLLCAVDIATVVDLVVAAASVAVVLVHRCASQVHLLAQKTSCTECMRTAASQGT